MGFCRQKYWHGLPFPSPGDMENPAYPWVSFPTQGLNPDLLHCRQILYQLSYKGKLLSQPKPRIKSVGLNGGTGLGMQIWAWQPNKAWVHWLQFPPENYKALTVHQVRCGEGSFSCEACQAWPYIGFCLRAALLNVNPGETRHDSKLK